VDGTVHIFSAKEEKSLTFQFKLDNPTTVSTKLDFSYFIRPAFWQAEYDVRVGRPTPGAGQYEVEIDYYANVEQRTDEEWEEVYLSLSTSNPAPAPSIPAINSRGVYFQQFMGRQ
jgi:hypothetical protein